MSMQYAAGIGAVIAGLAALCLLAKAAFAVSAPFVQPDGAMGCFAGEGPQSCAVGGELKSTLALLVSPDDGSLYAASLTGAQRTLGVSAPPVVIGHSVRERPITARRIGDPTSGRKVLVVGAIHGDEGAGRAIVRRLAIDGAVASSDIWLISTVNPDGSRQAKRTNARGVDLNRNFSRGWRASSPDRPDYAGPRAFSEPETRAVRRLILRLRPRVTIWFHQPWGQVLAPCRGSAPQQRRYARIADLPVKRCRGSELPGTATRWQMHSLRASTAFVVELGPGRLTPAAIRRHARAVRAVAE